MHAFLRAAQPRNGAPEPAGPHTTAASARVLPHRSHPRAPPPAPPSEAPLFFLSYSFIQPASPSNTEDKTGRCLAATDLTALSVCVCCNLPGSEEPFCRFLWLHGSSSLLPVKNRLVPEWRLRASRPFSSPTILCWSPECRRWGRLHLQGCYGAWEESARIGEGVEEVTSAGRLTPVSFWIMMFAATRLSWEKGK